MKVFFLISILFFPIASFGECADLDIKFYKPSEKTVSLLFPKEKKIILYGANNFKIRVGYSETLKYRNKVEKCYQHMKYRMDNLGVVLDGPGSLIDLNLVKDLHEDFLFMVMQLVASGRAEIEEADGKILRKVRVEVFIDTHSAGQIIKSPIGDLIMRKVYIVK